MNIAEKDLADLSFNGLRSHLKERLECYDLFTVTQVHQRALAIESRSKVSQESHRHHRSSVHALDCNSDCSDDESSMYMLLSLFGHLKPNHLLVLLLSRFTKIGRMKNLLLIYPSAKGYLMSYIGLDMLRCHILYRRLKS